MELVVTPCGLSRVLETVVVSLSKLFQRSPNVLLTAYLA